MPGSRKEESKRINAFLLIPALLGVMNFSRNNSIHVIRIEEKSLPQQDDITSPMIAAYSYTVNKGILHFLPQNDFLLGWGHNIYIS